MTFGVNDYPRYSTPLDPFGYASNQCASFSNFRCMHDLGLPAIHNPAGNDGGVFADTLHNLYDVAMDGNPQVHDIMSIPAFTHGTGKYGHTAVVLAVNNNGTVFVEDYNWYGTGQYLQHTINYSGCKFAHVKGAASMDRNVVQAIVRMGWWGIGRGEPTADTLVAYTNAAMNSGDVDGVIARLRDSPEGGAWANNSAVAANGFAALAARVTALEQKTPAPAPAPGPAPTPTTLPNAAGLEAAITNAINALNALLVEVKKTQ